MTTNQLPPLPPAAVDEHNPQGGRLLYTRQTNARVCTAALAQQAQEPVAWAPIPTSAGGRKAVFEFFRNKLKRHDFDSYINEALAADFACVLGGYLAANTTPQPQPAQQVPEKCLTCSGHGMIGGHMPDGSGHGEPCPDCNAPPVPAPVDEREAFEASMREKHGWEDRDFKSDSFGYFDGHTATAWLAWQARATHQPTKEAEKP